MRNIGEAAIRKRLTRVDIHGQTIHAPDKRIVYNVKRVLDIICEWKRQGCTMIYGGGVLTAHKKNFEGRIDIKNGPRFSEYDAVLLEYIKELL